MRNVAIIEGVLSLVPTKSEGTLIVVHVPEESDVYTAMKAVGHSRIKHRNLVVPTLALRSFFVTGRKVETDDITIEAFDGRDGKVFRFGFKVGKAVFTKTVGYKKIEEALIESEALTVSASVHRTLIDLYRVEDGKVTFGAKVDAALSELDNAVRDEVAALQELKRSRGGERRPEAPKADGGRKPRAERTSGHEAAKRYNAETLHAELVRDGYAFTLEQVVETMRRRGVTPSPADGMFKEEAAARIVEALKNPRPPKAEVSEAPVAATTEAPAPTAPTAHTETATAPQAEDGMTLTALAKDLGKEVKTLKQLLSSCGVEIKPADRNKSADKIILPAKAVAAVRAKLAKTTSTEAAVKDGKLVHSPFAALGALAAGTE